MPEAGGVQVRPPSRQGGGGRTSRAPFDDRTPVPVELRLQLSWGQVGNCRVLDHVTCHSDESSRQCQAGPGGTGGPPPFQGRLVLRGRWCVIWFLRWSPPTVVRGNERPRLCEPSRELRPSRRRAGDAVLPEEGASGPGRAAYLHGLTIRTRLSPSVAPAPHPGASGTADGLAETRAGISRRELPPVRSGGTPETADPPLQDRDPDGDEHERPSRP